VTVRGIAESDTPGGRGSDAATPLSRRRVHRRRVLKSGQLRFGFSGSTVDCQILDESPYGLLVETDIRVPVPDQLAIRLDGGGIFHVIRRWDIDKKIGLEFVGPQVVDQATRVRMQSILDILDAHGLTAALDILRAQSFFDNTALRRAAEDAGGAMAKLRILLACEPANESPPGVEP